eukprot:TRINITY_DN30411_c0_g1_i1.p1 TRINITY_DN30411_c0_g1~~TRINITY_DN30411_c0_g1_i1.p1  ORF type:complete len:522 (-),score=101.17 TRINITY_DN30411_c0_g1_i1:50-1555(-)
MSTANDYDLVVIGSGAAGLTAAITAAKWGAKVVIIEKLNRLGGDCTWYGCVPSKALIRCARAAAEARTGARFGVVGVDPAAVRVDWQAVQKHVRGCQDHIYSHDDSPEKLTKEGVEVIAGRTACFQNPHTLQLTPTDEESGSAGSAPTTITADRFIICTGAGPALPPIVGLESVPFATYETIFDLPTLPARLAVVGGGPIGSELAQAFARLGSKVTIVGKLMPREDDDVRVVMKRAFTADGITVIDGRAAKAEKGAKEDTVVLHTSDGTCVVVDVLLVSSGRRPRGLEALGLDKAFVKWSSEEGIIVDGKLMTTAKHIFAAGDCVGGLQFTHLAGMHGGLAAWNALMPGLTAQKAPAAQDCPRCTFTHPEVATVGMTEAEARAKCGGNLKVKTRNLERVDRAVCEGETEGFVKILYTKEGNIVGATVVASVAGEIASELGLAIKAGTRVGKVAMTIHSYPTFSFVLQQMAAEIYSEQLRKSTPLSCVLSCCGRRLKGDGPT